MIRLTVEEMNLLSIYHEGSKAQLMENMTLRCHHGRGYAPLCRAHLTENLPTNRKRICGAYHFAADEV